MRLDQIFAEFSACLIIESIFWNLLIKEDTLYQK